MFINALVDPLYDQLRDAVRWQLEWDFFAEIRSRTLYILEINMISANQQLGDLQ